MKYTSDFNSQFRFLKKGKISLIVSALIFSGCSVNPELLTVSEIENDVKANIAQLDTMNQTIEKPITLEEAIDRAVHYNLEQKVEMMNSIIAHQKIDAVTYEALPELMTKAGYGERSEYAASASTSFSNGNPSPLTSNPSYSVSQDKRSINAGASFSWNILDFGLSYVRAKQQSDKYLIAKENERKAKYNLEQNVRFAYYQAVSADELLSKLEPIMQKTREALEDSKNIHQLKLDSPLKTLTYQRELLEVVRTLNVLEESLIQSKTALAKLMGLKPGTKYSLSEKIQQHYFLPTIPTDINLLEKTALENRPELQEARYQVRISDQELTAIKLKLLPGINLNAGINYDDNKYLLNNQWMSYGANVSWNLFSVFSINQNMNIAQTSLELAKLQKLAISMGVISQVHLAMIDFKQAKKEYQVSEEYAKVASDIYQIIESQTALNVNGKLSLIKEELNYLVSNLKLASSYAKVQNAYGKLIVSVGKPELFTQQQEEKATVQTVVEPQHTPVKENVIPPVLKEMPLKDIKKEEPVIDVSTQEMPSDTNVSKPQTMVENTKQIEEPKVAEEVTQPKTYAESLTFVYIRSRTDLHAPIVRKIKKKEILEVIGSEAGWLKTPEGYIYKKYFKLYTK